jgi:hypothetical protein
MQWPCDVDAIRDILAALRPKEGWASSLRDVHQPSGETASGSQGGSDKPAEKESRAEAERNVDLIRKERDEAVWAMAALRKALKRAKADAQQKADAHRNLRAALDRLDDA